MACDCSTTNATGMTANAASGLAPLRSMRRKSSAGTSAQTHEPGAGQLKEPIVVDVRAPFGGEREHVVPGNRARLQDESAGGEMPSGAGIAQPGTGVPDADRDLDQEEDDLEVRCDPAPHPWLGLHERR